MYPTFTSSPCQQAERPEVANKHAERRQCTHVVPISISAPFLADESWQSRSWWVVPRVRVAHSVNQILVARHILFFSFKSTYGKKVPDHTFLRWAIEPREGYMWRHPHDE